MSSVVDFHTHVLPGIDDGSGSIAESLALLRMEAEQGIGHMVATPHFYAQTDTLKAFLDRRNGAERRLREAMEGLSGLPRITLGAEVRYFPGIGEADILEALAIGGGGYVLVEMPQTGWTGGMYRDLEKIRHRLGLTPILAHVDRYMGPMGSFADLERLMELPVLVQANASYFRRPLTKRAALRMLAQDQIHLLGSDCHNLYSRPVNLRQALDRIESRLGLEAIARINAREAQVLAGGTAH